MNSFKWSLYWVITWKLLFGEGTFLVWEMNNFLLLGGIPPPPICRISLKGLDEGTGDFQISYDYETENVHHRQNFCLNLSKSY